MDEPATAEAGVPSADLVVVDRSALRQLLTAVASALEASVSLDSAVQQEGLDAEQLALLRQEVLKARQDLAQGVRRVITSIDQLPRAQVEERGGAPEA
jgi:hypothetical protein